MNRIRLLTLLFCLATSAVFAQPKLKPAGKLTAAATEKLHTMEDTLAILSYAVVNDSIEAERFAACRSLITGLVRALKTENSFNYKFERLKSVSVLYPPDSSFRIFTWQLFVNDSTYKYYGAIQMNSRELVLHALLDRSHEMETKPLAEQLPPDNWYGALYYNLRSFDTRSGPKYLLFGFDGFEFFEKRKVIDVLSFDPKTGKPMFGATVFDRDPEPGRMPTPPETRLILEYSAEASVRCNWDEQYQMVLFDHLIPSPSPFGRGMTNIPDGSVEGFTLENGRWKHISKVFNDVMSEPPRPEPVLGKPGKNILGKDKKKSKTGW
ncbi:MAG: hypothetical protein ACK4Q5_18990 [Saprospiraceae bacterium]